MVPVTLAVAVIAGILAFVLHPVRAFALVITSMFLYPEYMRFPMGISKMSVTRIVAMVLLIRMLKSPEKKEFKWHKGDSLILWAWLWSIMANILAKADFDQIKFVIGQSFDTLMMYFTARLAFFNRKNMGLMVAPIFLTALIMGFFGAMESVTSSTPYDFFFKHHEWLWLEKKPEYRLGLLRAKGSTSHYIYFGMSMLYLAGYVWALRAYSKSILPWTIGMLAALVGVCSSLSSGPIIGVTVFMFCSSLFYMKWAIKPLVWMFIFSCVAIELFSNRHFFQIVDHIALSSGTAWYRGKLIEVAIQQYYEYWLYGMGSNIPHHWGGLIDGRRHVDLVNQYIIVAVKSGFLGLYLYVHVIIVAFKEGIKAYNESRKSDQTFIFSQLCLLIAICVSSMSVGLYGPPLILLYLTLGMIIGKQSVSDETKELKNNSAPKKIGPKYNTSW